jgi:short-subunit dehydrogenase
MGKFKTLLCLAGLYSLGKPVYDIGYNYYALNYREPVDLAARYGRGYVLITGGTDGLGYSYAKSFAKRGFNLILVSRSAEKLQNVATKLSTEYAVDVKTYPFDFREAGTNTEKFEQLAKAFENTDVSIVLNNVGLFSFGKMEHMTTEQIRDMIVVNTFTQAFLSNVFTKQLLRRDKRYKSALINVGSEAGDIPSAFFSLYAGTKAFSNLFTESLNAEYGDRLDVVLFKPSTMYTPMVLTGLPGAKDWYIIDPDESAESSLRMLGHGDWAITGGFRHVLYQTWLWYTKPFSKYYRAYVNAKSANN